MASVIKAGNATDGVQVTSDNTGILELKTGTGAGTTAMTLDASQNVGIGTSSPTNKLHVLSTSSEVARFIRDNTSNASGGITIGNNSRVFTIYGDNSALSFWDTTAAAQRMTLDASGNLGVGTTSPAAKLDVSNGSIRASNTGGYYTNLTATGLTNSSTTMDFDSVSSYIFKVSSSEKMRLDSSGNLLVGKTSNADSVVGSMIRGTGYITSTWAETTNATTTYHLYSTGTGGYRFYVGLGGTVFAVSTTISAVSDQRLKENIQDLDVGLDAVMALKPRKFDWKEGQGKDIKGDRGFIAQEFETVFPDLIDEWRDPAPEGEEPYKSVRQDLIPVLVKAIQELKAELDATKAEIAALKGAAQ